MSSISFTSICALEKSWYITTLSNVRLWFLKTLANYFHSKRDIGIIRISLLSIQLPLTFHRLPSPFLFSPLFTFLLLLTSSPFSFPLPLLLSFPFSFPSPTQSLISLILTPRLPPVLAPIPPILLLTPFFLRSQGRLSSLLTHLFSLWASSPFPPPSFLIKRDGRGWGSEGMGGGG